MSRGHRGFMTRHVYTSAKHTAEEIWSTQATTLSGNDAGAPR
jgi:hypothetical protein